MYSGYNFQQGEILYDCILYIIKIDSGRLKKCPSKLSAYFSPAMFGLDGFVWNCKYRYCFVRDYAENCSCSWNCLFNCEIWYMHPGFSLELVASGCTIISNPHSQYILPSQQDTIPPPHLTDNNCSDYISTMDQSRFHDSLYTKRVRWTFLGVKILNSSMLQRMERNEEVCRKVTNQEKK